MNVKIIGAGSIGNHLAQASRRMGWAVTVVDRDPEALRRMRESIYPQRYGAWDPAIKLATSDAEPRGNFDIICIGTPPDTHLPLAIKALDEKPKLLQIEKPLCAPSLEGLDGFLAKLKQHPETKVIVGYDHAIGEGIKFVADLLERKEVGDIETIDVEFREHWQGIFNAHPWLSGPRDTYLGFSAQGGGASGEHSHALHLWQFLADRAGLGKWKQVHASLAMKREEGAEYDAVAAFLLTTDQNKIGRVVQDVVTLPVRKWALLQGTKGFIEWHCNGDPKGDVVKYGTKDNVQVNVFEKKRPDDFYRETMHMQDIIDGRVSAQDSPLSLASAVAVMRALSAAHAARQS